MNWGPWLFIFYSIVFFTAGAISWSCANWYLSNRNFNGVALIMLRQGVQLLALSYFLFSELVAHAFGFKVNPVYTIGFAIAHWQGMVVLTCSLIWLHRIQSSIDKSGRTPIIIVWLLRVVSRKRKKPSSPAR